MCQEGTVNTLSEISEGQDSGRLPSPPLGFSQRANDSSMSERERNQTQPQEPAPRPYGLYLKI